MQPTNKTQPMGLKDFFKQMSRAFMTPPISPTAAGPGFSSRTETLPNNGGTYMTPVPNMSMAPASGSYGSIDYVDPKIGIRSLYGSNGNADFASPQPATPSGGNTPPPSGGRTFSGGGTPAPAPAPTSEAPANLDYSKYMNPKTGKPYSPKEYADLVASRVGGGMVPGYAGDSITRDMGVEELSGRARELNNARNDMAVGEKDPFGVASKSGIQYTPAELSAIEKAYAGVFDPALNDVFAKLETKQKQEEEEKERRARIEQTELESELRLKEMGEQNKYDIMLKKTRSGDFKDDGAGGGSAGGGSGEFASTVDLVSNMEGTVFGKKAVGNQLRSLIDAKDYAGAYNVIANTVENFLVGEPKTKYMNARTDYGVMEGMKKAIQEYAAGGGDMNILKGTEEEIKRKLGIDSGKASALATYLWREFQTYRNNMTGAAFGAGESRDYASVNPHLGKTLDLNLSVIDGAQQQLANRVYSTIDQRVPSAKFIREYAEGAVPGGTGGSSRSSVLTKDGQSFDASALSQTEYDQAITDGYQPQ